MATILHIETSARTCSVALSQDGALLLHKEDREGPNHAVLCGVFCEEALSFAESHAIPLDAVAVSQGPGSYTGLRIGVSMAKGIAYGRGVPLVAVLTLPLLCVPLLLRERVEEGALLVPMIDARRMEVYTAVYDRALKEVRPIQAEIVTEQSFSDILAERPVYVFGDGADKCKDVIKHPNARFLDGIVPLAKNMLPLAERAFLRGEFQDTAYFEPFYLKEFVAIKSKNLL
ncbi:MAG: tRNA (adenosine(37)-N6)-threonylcarbamoyltransferase complex dimerization subunit type 1 TsaB [Bacteroidaceae bacterium]|nr:tRNA (adenosine(37)-N6)-threonylcarbamoyltransferase complex dimerization subunit type 1 TsaB [Bacteroidaceae bacterium]